MLSEAEQKEYVEKRGTFRADDEGPTVLNPTPRDFSQLPRDKQHAVFCDKLLARYAAYEWYQIITLDLC